MKTPAEINSDGAVAVEAGSAIGKSVDMYAGRSRVDGTIEFALNAEIPGMLHAAWFAAPSRTPRSSPSTSRRPLSSRVW